MKAAWVDHRKGRYFVGPYSATLVIDVLGVPPYHVLDASCSADELGHTVKRALNASAEEALDAEGVARVGEERMAALAALARVKHWRTYERGTRHVDVEYVSANEILITPNFRKRGYWEPVPEAQWLRLRHPSDAELGEATMTAVARSSG